MSVFSELVSRKPGDDSRVEQKQDKEPLVKVNTPETPDPWISRAEEFSAASVPRPAQVAVPTLRLNLDRLARLGMVSPGLENSRIVEEYRYIKRPLLNSAFERNDEVALSNVVSVTSSHPAEGKTFNAINLALSIAMERDRQVLLIDGDIERGGLSRTLGVAKRPGLSDLLLSDDKTAAGVMFKVDGVERLRVLPAGPLRQDAAELLASQRMAALIEETANRYPDRMIIVDSPPLLASSSAKVLAEHAGQVIVIVAAGETTTSSLDEAMNLLPEDKPVKLILNKARKTSSNDEYRYGYYNGEEG